MWHEPIEEVGRICQLKSPLENTARTTLYCINQIARFSSSLVASLPDAPLTPADSCGITPPPGRREQHLRCLTIGMQLFTAEEVIARLRRYKNTAPGLDRISYLMWKRANPVSSTTDAFRAPGRRQRQSSSRRRASTRRPIALSCTIYKLYARYLAARMNAWLQQHDVLHPAQKGLTHHDGMFEHNFVLGATLQEARRGRRRPCVAWIDLDNAFPLVPHEVVHVAAGAGE